MEKDLDSDPITFFLETVNEEDDCEIASKESVSSLSPIDEQLRILATEMLIIEHGETI